MIIRPKGVWGFRFWGLGPFVCVAGLSFSAVFADVVPVSAGTITFGSGDAAGSTIEVAVRKVETFRVGGRSKSTAVNRTFSVRTLPGFPGERHAEVRLVKIGLGTASSPDDVARISGETEIYLLNALADVAVVLTYSKGGDLQGVAEWEKTRRAVLAALMRRVGALKGGTLVLHPKTRLGADVVRSIDAAVAAGFVELISSVEPEAFLEAFYQELAFLFLMAGERVAVGESIARPMVARNPADGSLTKLTHVFRLRKADRRRSRAYFRLGLAGGGIEILRKSIVKQLKATGLGDHEIEGRVAAMPMHWDVEGRATVNISTGRMRDVRMRSRIQVDNIELTSTEEIDIRTAR
jgi:hypothetical protein